MDAFYDYFSTATNNSPLALASVTLTGNIGMDLENMTIASNKEGLAFLGCAYASAMMPASGVSKTFDNIGDVSVTVLMPKNFDRAKESAAENAAFVYSDETGNTPMFYNERKGQENYGEFSMANIEYCPDPEAQGWLRTVVGGHADFKGMFFNLAAAHQVKKLKASQVASYFLSIGERDVQGMIFEQKFDALVKGLPKLVADQRARAMLKTDKWMEYRLTFATTTGLFKKMLDDCPVEYMMIFSDATLAIIRESIANPWDEARYRNIPVKALAALYAYYKVLNSIPANLWGPTKAYQDLSSAEKISLDRWFGYAVNSIKALAVHSLTTPKAESMPDSIRSI